VRRHAGGDPFHERIGIEAVVWHHDRHRGMLVQGSGWTTKQFTERTTASVMAELVSG
jgi:hypothetical protein